MQSIVLQAIATEGLVNVPHLAEIIRLRNISENIAREDIELLILHQAQASGVPMSFAPDAFAVQTSLLAQ